MRWIRARSWVKEMVDWKYVSFASSCECIPYTRCALHIYSSSLVSSALGGYAPCRSLIGVYVTAAPDSHPPTRTRRIPDLLTGNHYIMSIHVSPLVELT